jgi:hypothetical protein
MQLFSPLCEGSSIVLRPLLLVVPEQHPNTLDICPVHAAQQQSNHVQCFVRPPPDITRDESWCGARYDAGSCRPSSECSWRKGFSLDRPPCLIQDHCLEKTCPTLTIHGCVFLSCMALQQDMLSPLIELFSSICSRIPRILTITFRRQIFRQWPPQIESRGLMPMQLKSIEECTNCGPFPLSNKTPVGPCPFLSLLCSHSALALTPSSLHQFPCG